MQILALWFSLATEHFASDDRRYYMQHLWALLGTTVTGFYNLHLLHDSLFKRNAFFANNFSWENHNLSKIVENACYGI